MGAAESALPEGGAGGASTGTSTGAMEGSGVAAAEAAALSSAYIAALARKPHEALDAVAAGMVAEAATPPAVPAARAELPASFDPDSQFYAPLVRTALTDAAVAAAHAACVGPGRLHATPAAFWGDYFARVLAALQLAGLGSSSAGKPRATAPDGSTGSGAGGDGDEQLLLFTSPDTFCYKVPPRPSATGHRAESWGLDSPVLTGYTRVVAVGEAEVVIAIWQRPDQFRGAAPAATPAAATAAAAGSAVVSSIATAPAAAGHRLVATARARLAPDSVDADAMLEHPLGYYLEPVVDSSRYFVLRLDGGGGRVGYMGIGFADRQPAFDLKSCILDHLACLARQRRLARYPPPPADTAASDEPAASDAAASSSLALTGAITVTPSWASPPARGGGGAAAASTPAATSAGGGGAVVPRLRAPRSGAPTPQQAAAAAAAAPEVAAPPPATPPSQPADSGDDEAWGDFAAPPPPP